MHCCFYFSASFQQVACHCCRATDTRAHRKWCSFMQLYLNAVLEKYQCKEGDDQPRLTIVHELCHIAR
jgi:hypothetical protein